MGSRVIRGALAAEGHRFGGGGGGCGGGSPAALVLLSGPSAASSKGDQQPSAPLEPRQLSAYERSCHNGYQAVGVPVDTFPIQRG